MNHRSKKHLAAAPAACSRREACQRAGLGVAALALPACSGAAGPSGGADLGAGDQGGGARDLGGQDLRPARDLSGQDLSGADLASGGCGTFDTGVTPASIALRTAFELTGTDLYIVRDAKGLYCLSGICTHMSCAVSFVSADAGFSCPCHGSRFNLAGDVTGGPAPSSLRHYALCLSGSGTVVIDEGQEVASTVRYNL